MDIVKSKPALTFDQYIVAHGGSATLLDTGGTKRDPRWNRSVKLHELDQDDVYDGFEDPPSEGGKAISDFATPDLMALLTNQNPPDKSES